MDLSRLPHLAQPILQAGAGIAELPLRTLKSIASLGGVFRTRAPQGARPDMLAPKVGAVPTTIHVIDYTTESYREWTPESPEDLRDHARADSVTWVDVQGLGSEAMLRSLGDVFAIHPLALADMVNTPQRAKDDDYGRHHLVIARMATRESNQPYHLEQVSFWIGTGYVVVVQEDPGDVFGTVRERLRTGAPIRRLGSDYLFYALIDALIDGYYPVIEDIGEKIETIENELANGDPRPDLVSRIHGARRELLTLQRILWQHRELLAGLVRGDRSFASEEVRPYLRDVLDHTVQILEVVETYRDVTVGLMDLYLSTISNRMNEVMKVLTIMASVFIPLTFLAGVYGMNFEHMPELHHPQAYPIVLTVMLFIGIGMLVYFRRRGWLG